MSERKAQILRRDLLKCSAAGAALTLGASVYGDNFAGGETVKKTNNKAFYKADGSFDPEAARKAYFDMFESLDYPVPDSLKTDQFWVCDFLQGDFGKLGMGGIFWINANGIYGQSGSKSYAGKFKEDNFGYLGHDIFLLPGQTLPEHHHIGGPKEYPDTGPKMESWLVRYGSADFFGEYKASDEKPISELPKQKHPWGYGKEWFKCKFAASRTATDGTVYSLTDPESWHFMRAGENGAIVTEYATFHNHVSFSKPDMEFDNTAAS